MRRSSLGRVARSQGDALPDSRKFYHQLRSTKEVDMSIVVKASRKLPLTVSQGNGVARDGELKLCSWVLHLILWDGVWRRFRGEGVEVLFFWGLVCFDGVWVQGVLWWLRTCVLVKCGMRSAFSYYRTTSLLQLSGQLEWWLFSFFFFIESRNGSHSQLNDYLNFFTHRPKLRRLNSALMGFKLQQTLRELD